MPASDTSSGFGPSRTPELSKRAGGLVAVLIALLAVVVIGGGLALVYHASVAARSAASASRAAGGVASGAAGTLAGVGATSASAPDGAQLRVTRRFGATPMLARGVVPRASDNVLALLSREITVTTSYGGGFVDSIGGVASAYRGADPIQEDWFFYVNGLQSHVGAADVHMRAGDRVWWDFHRWSFATSVPAVVGQFPAPFASAGRAGPPTHVLYASGFEPEARRIAATLAADGATGAVMAPADDAAISRLGHVVLVGRWVDLAGLSAVRDATAVPGASGMFARFVGGGASVEALGELGGVALNLPGAGAVLATVKPGNANSVLWLVTGSDASDVRAAAALLADGGARLAGRFGALVERDGTVASLPIADGR